MPPTNKRTAHPRENHTASILSRKPPTVARQTITPPKSSHSLKTAEIVSRCLHAWQGLPRLLGASRCLSAPISAANESPRYKELEGAKNIANSGTNKVKKKLRTLNRQKLRTLNSLFCENPINH